MTATHRRARVLAVCFAGAGAGVIVQSSSGTCPDNCGGYNCNQAQVLNWCPVSGNDFSNELNWDNDAGTATGIYACPVGNPPDNDCCCAPPDSMDELALRGKDGKELMIIDDAAHVIAQMTVWGAVDTGLSMAIQADNDLTVNEWIHLKHGTEVEDTVSLTVTADEGEGTVSADYIWHEGYGRITVTPNSGASLTTY